MQKKFVSIMIIAVIIFTTVFITKCTNDMYYKEMTYDILSFKEIPEFVQNRINESEVGLTSNMRIKGSDGPYIVLTPPEDMSVEVLFVGKDTSITYGVVYRYKYTDKVSDDTLDNIKIIKINNYDGDIVGIFVSN